MGSEQDGFFMHSSGTPDTTLVEMRGKMDEDAVFKEVPAARNVVINLKNVSLLNSAGTLSWCRWIENFSAPTEVQLCEVPVIMVKNFSSVRMILSSRCRVSSFYVPFFSGKTGERTTILFERGVHFTDDGKISLPSVLDRNGQPMELDVVPELYFRFITDWADY